MNYKLGFHPKALKEWEKLDSAIKDQFKKKLKEILQNPQIPKNRLRGSENLYKIKLKKSGFRLVYKVEDETLLVLVLIVAKREDVYKALLKRL